MGRQRQAVCLLLLIALIATVAHVHGPTIGPAAPGWSDGAEAAESATCLTCVRSRTAAVIDVVALGPGVSGHRAAVLQTVAGSIASRAVVGPSAPRAPPAIG